MSGEHYRLHPATARCVAVCACGATWPHEPEPATALRYVYPALPERQLALWGCTLRVLREMFVYQGVPAGVVAALCLHDAKAALDRGEPELARRLINRVTWALGEVIAPLPPEPRQGKRAQRIADSAKKPRQGKRAQRIADSAKRK